MLVLSRKADEAVVIGDDIRIVVLSIDSDRIRIGIDAPKTMRIFREELLKQTADVNKEAIKSPAININIGNIIHGSQEK